MQKFLHLYLIVGLLLVPALPALEEEPPACEGHLINFNDVPIIEFIRFVSKISGKNFVYNAKDLNFSISFSTGKALQPETVVHALVQLLQSHGLKVSLSSGYYVIHNSDVQFPIEQIVANRSDAVLASMGNLPLVKQDIPYEFSVYKLQYHEGPEIEDSLKKIAADLHCQPNAPTKLIQAIQSLQWVKATNSLLFSADPETLEKLNHLVASLDLPLRQVFIEVLVIETDVKKSMEFGLQWASSGKVGNKLGYRGGSADLAGVAKLDQLPILPGFELGVIGDMITHRGTSYLSLSSLVSALQLDRDSTIVLNQKMITQDNKNSTIFVGDNIPFTGSVIQTVGQSQQTTANIEYRDIGVRLSLTPRLGEGDVITLQLNEEITEALEPDLVNTNRQVNGIRTTKTNMSTNVHVPDKHFLVLSGMIRNTKSYQKAGLPCLGGIPGLGAAFSKTERNDEKRNIIIFVRPHIVRSFDDYQALTQKQEEVFRNQAEPQAFDAGVGLVQERD